MNNNNNNISYNNFFFKFKIRKFTIYTKFLLVVGTASIITKLVLIFMITILCKKNNNKLYYMPIVL